MRAAFPNSRRSPIHKKNRPRDATCVALIGFDRPAPREFGDNKGAWPVRLSIGSDPQAALRRADLEQPYRELKIIGTVWCPTRVHAERLRDVIADLLLGKQESELRHGWRDVEDPHAAWSVLLGQAIEAVQAVWPEFSSHPTNAG